MTLKKSDEKAMILTGLSAAFVLGALFYFLPVLAAWIPPLAEPPAGNNETPLNATGTGQSKIGGLLLNSGGAANGLLVQSGNVGIGILNPIAKLEVSGIIHSLTGGVKFPDNSVQTTAATIIKIACNWTDWDFACVRNGTARAFCSGGYVTQLSINPACPSSGGGGGGGDGGGGETGGYTNADTHDAGGGWSGFGDYGGEGGGAV